MLFQVTFRITVMTASVVASLSKTCPPTNWRVAQAQMAANSDGAVTEENYIKFGDVSRYTSKLWAAKWTFQNAKRHT